MRISDQRTFVLRTFAYSETSLLVDVFARETGRLMLIAKGARRLKSRQRGLLRPFQPLLLSWSGRGELPIVSGAEQAGWAVPLMGDAWLCGYYMNELLVHLLHRYDAHEGLFDGYEQALESLARNPSGEATLRLFEKRLLGELGYGLRLEFEADGRTPVVGHHRYDYVPDRGPVPLAASMQGPVEVSGATLLALADEQLEDRQVLLESKQLLRVVLDRHLDGRALRSRRLFQQMRDAALTLAVAPAKPSS